MMTQCIMPSVSDELFALPDNDVFLGFAFVLTKRRAFHSLYELWTKLNSSYQCMLTVILQCQ